MALALKDWWRKLNGATFVEKGDALYPAMNWGMTWGGGYVVLQLPNLLFALIISRWLGRSSWVDMLLIFALLALLTGLVVLIGYRIERRRFPLGRPLVRKDQDTLTMAEARYLGYRPTWPVHIKVPLQTLCCITFETQSGWSIPWSYSIRFTFSNGEEKRMSAPYINSTMLDFLQRKLPPSIQFTVDNEPPLLGRGGL